MTKKLGAKAQKLRERAVEIKKRVLDGGITDALWEEADRLGQEMEECPGLLGRVANEFRTYDQPEYIAEVWAKVDMKVVEEVLVYGCPYDGESETPEELADLIVIPIAGGVDSYHIQKAEILTDVAVCLALHSDAELVRAGELCRYSYDEQRFIEEEEESKSCSTV